ncbi:type III restriction-modification system endonuclease [Flavobacterium sp. TP390]|uniref:Type III restriction-modification system endonuclease n=1 Tax=Flavobacterium profundi TaxID=1774945 RepID=A0A6I4IEH2_9FLAO|nr:type III restriction-modification system endonuclease [Flavobacterium profundi]MVO07994.1 type III restriction-modification system endonuclease [Flavobacterium profundi]
MELILKNGLPHQDKGVQAVANAFSVNSFSKNKVYYANPTLELDKEALLHNIKEVQKTNGIHPEYTALNGIQDYLNLDIKMETGTGKTYVHTATIFELHKQYKINKFIIVVPTLAIKAGTRQFIQDPYTKKHFKDVCGYGTEIELQVLDAAKKKKGKQFFPSAVREFVSGSSQNQNKIYVLLVNMALLTNSKMLKDQYDSGVEDFYKPVEGISATKPFLLIDEPHRFSKAQKTFEFITNEIQPQCIIRFGATYPTVTIGKGTVKKTIKDYHNLLYDLNACESFNQNLIKGIAKEHFEPLSKKEDKVKIMAIQSKTSAKFNLIQKDGPTKSFELKKDDSLSIISEEFEGIVIDAIGSNFIELSNGQTKSQGEEFSTDIYSSSYQEQMLKLAIDRHFETERINFDRKFKIKTLALFFIDDIYSYRQDEKSGKETYLKNTFEKLLLDKINQVIPTLNKDTEKEYLEFLEASKKDITACHAGYFSQDNSSSDEEIANEINEILFEKKKLLSIKKEDGSYNTRRFLFSKWTLKEGWDNPNVFTITKLRSSGSESSKIQEVGRGLRLPVDELGNRISNEEFKLNYIIDFTEADFADRLVKEINDELPKGFVITEEKLNEVAKKLEHDPDDLFFDLISKKYIDRKYNINIENQIQFFEEYPDFAMGLNGNKVVDRNTKKDKKIKIRPAVYNELKTLWEAINQKYVLFYDKIEEDNYLKEELVKLFENNVFTDVIITSRRQVIQTTDDNQMMANEDSGVQYTISRPLPYSEFLKRINKQTNIPIQLIHEALIIYASKQPIDNDKINEFSVANFVSRFNDWKINKLQGRFSYSKSNIKLYGTKLSFPNGQPKEEITQGIIGTKFIEGTPVEKYLYDTYAYDSPLEKDNIQAVIDEVVVYGKIPRSSISIPTITGQSYSPDFMYVVKKVDGSKTLNIVVETKDVENQSTLRKIEEVKINCAKEFFKQLTIDGYTVEFHEQLNNKKIKQIVDEVLINN